MMDWLRDHTQWINDHTLLAPLFDFVYYYPLFMAWMWVIGGAWYYFHYERKDSADPDAEPELSSYPKVSIVVPCYNEEDNVEEVVTALDKMIYPDFEIICINDGSKDRTGEILDSLLPKFPRLRVIHQAKNQGKAVGLNTAAVIANSEYLLCIDGDAILDPHCIAWLLRHFLFSSRVGAVTGNPRIRTRSTLLGKIQVGEFSSIIGLIKRAQRTYGRIFTVSGVCAMFRRTALHEIGYWSPDMMCEDIDVSWKLQTQHWDVHYEPRALVWILMPETLSGLWKQRVRWAMGGIQVMMKYWPMFKSWRQRRMWPIFAEYVTSVVWANCMALVLFLWVLTMLWPGIPHGFHVNSVAPGWHGVIVGFTCLVQLLVSMMIDSRYERDLLRYYVWMIWYPIAYWLLSLTTTVAAVPKVMARGKGARATWVSPDRGLRKAA
jgi:poly-beta-1,6-N-acetyl-D-glucosamine synthase